MKRRFAGLVLVLLAGCRVFPSLDQFTGGEVTDAGADATPPDTTTDHDAASDAGAEASAPFCTPDAIVCDQFERADGGVQGPWDAVETSGATIVLDPTPHGTTNPTTSAKASVVASASDGAFARLRHHVDATVQHATFRFSAYVVTRASQDYQLGGFTFYGSGAARAVYITFRQGGFRLTEQELGGTNAHQEYDALQAPAQDAWHDYVVDVDLVARHATVTVDGATSIDTPLSLAFGKSSFDVQAAVSDADAGPAFDVWLDDVRVDATP